MQRQPQRLRFVLPLALAVLVAVLETSSFADAKDDYARVWGPKEKRAQIPADRTKLAEELMDAANKVIDGARPRKRGTRIADQSDSLQSLKGDPREEVIILCTKAYEVGSKQREGYAPAARALGILQTLDPEKRLDSLIKLKKMYEDAYQIAPSKNLGIAKGFAAVNMQIGEEQWAQLQEAQAKGKVPPAEQAEKLKAIAASYNKGLEVIRSVISTIRPHAKGKKAYEDFLESAAALEKDLVDSQKNIQGPLALAAETDRMLKSVASLQARAKANPKETFSADRLVRLYMNELDDPASIETVIKQSSAEVKDVISLMKKRVGSLTAAQAKSVATWLDKANDNPNSTNRTAMNVRLTVYCEAYQKVAKPQDADWKQIDLTLKKVNTDLAKAQLDADKVKTLAAAYIEALEPPVTVAVAPVEPEPAPAEKEPGKNDPPETVATTPDPVKPPVATKTPPKQAPVEVERPLASIKVEEPAPRETVAVERKSSGGGSSIFDFGAD
jgi:hypothetical protein